MILLLGVRPTGASLTHLPGLILAAAMVNLPPAQRSVSRLVTPPARPPRVWCILRQCFFWFSPDVKNFGPQKTQKNTRKSTNFQILRISILFFVFFENFPKIKKN